MILTQNYGARQANRSAYIKTFISDSTTSLWKIFNYIKLDGTNVQVLTPSSVKNVYIQGDLFVDGNIISPSDINLKTNIALLDINITDNLAQQFVEQGLTTKESEFGYADCKQTD